MTPSPPRPPTPPTTRRRWCCCWRSSTTASRSAGRRRARPPRRRWPPSRSASPPTPRSPFTRTTAPGPHAARQLRHHPRRRPGPAGHGRLHRRATPHPGEPILALPADAGLSFMTDRPPALYNPMFLPGLLDSRADEVEAIAQLEAEHVRYAVVERPQLRRLRLRTLRQRLQPHARRLDPPQRAAGGAASATAAPVRRDESGDLLLVYRLQGSRPLQRP